MNSNLAAQPITLADVIQLTYQSGGDWAICHALRLLKLIQDIGQDIPYDETALTLAAYLHDWGAFPRYQIPGVEHASRSRQIVEKEIFPYMELPSEVKEIAMEAIELHDYRDARPLRSNESLLLREADMLEFLGAVGTAREFAWGPNNLGISRQRILSRRDGIQGRFTLPRAQEMARSRQERMNLILGWLEEESFGILSRPSPLERSD